MAYKVKKDPIDKIPKAQFVFWIIVRISMLVCAGYSFIHGDLVMGFESVFCFIFTHLWDMFSATAVLLRKFRRLAKQCLILLFL